MFPGIKSCRGYCPVVPILDSQPSARTLCSRISIHGEIEIGYDVDPVDVTWLVQDALDRDALVVETVAGCQVPSCGATRQVVAKNHMASPNEPGPRPRARGMQLRRRRPH